MKRARHLAGVLSGAMIASLASGASSADETGSAIAQLSLTPADGSLAIKGSAVGVESGTISGELAIDRRGKSGSVVTRQSRTMELGPGDVADIASVSVSFQPGDEIIVDLVLSDGGVVIATASASTGAKTDE